MGEGQGMRCDDGKEITLSLCLFLCPVVSRAHCLFLGLCHVVGASLCLCLCLAPCPFVGLCLCLFLGLCPGLSVTCHYC